MKRCSNCGVMKPYDCFCNNRTMKGGKHCYCRECVRVLHKKWRMENLEKELKMGLKYRKNNKDKIKASTKKYRENNKEKIKAYNEKYRENNKEKMKKYRREHEAQRKNNDPLYRLNCNTSRAIGKALRKMGESKRKSTWEKVVKYTKEELRNRLERQFKDGMNWDNYGQWQLDHIRPISSFNYKNSNDEDFSKCWALDNLQPLWAEDNLRKSNKFGEWQ